MFARRVFGIAGVYGLLVVAPLYFLCDRISRQMPPAITHPEYFFGFTGVTLAWQVLFLILATDPVRYRPMMPAAVLEKAAFVIAIVWLYAQHRVAPPIFGPCLVDLLWAILFAAAYVNTGGAVSLPKEAAYHDH